MTGTKARLPRKLALVTVIAMITGCAQQPVTDVEEAASPSRKTDTHIREKHPEIVARHQPRAVTPPVKADTPDSDFQNDLWWVISDNLSFSQEVPDKQVAKQLSWLEGNQRYFDNTLPRAELYLPYVLEQVLAADLPAEAALLPFVESAYNPFANSPGGATGIWQFIPSTAEIYGLEETRWYEGRRDIVASTDAAIGYLLKLNAMFEGDWLLTFAAYNSGPGTVRRAMEKNARQGLDTDFWSLQLPPATRRYVPRLIALSKVISQADQYQVELKPLTTEIPFALVEIDRPLDLTTAAEIASVSHDELFKLNPAFTKAVTPPQGNHYLLVPTDSAEEFQEKLIDLPFQEWRPYQQYVVAAGDSLGKIATKNGMSAKELASVNGMKTDSILRIGQILQIPGRADTDIPSPKTGHQRYVVRSGDNLWSIARKYKIEVMDLMALNGFSSGEILQPGQKILVRDKRAPEVHHYEVRSGDSLYVIAKKFNVAMADLMTWNNLSGKSVLKPGQRLKISSY